MAGRIRARDWSATPLGPIEGWPDAVMAVVDLMLASPLVSSVALTADRLLLYNDPAARLYGDRHPVVLGHPLHEAFAESYPTVAPLYDRAFEGESVTVTDQPLAVGTGAGNEVFDAYLTPIRAADGAVIGVHMAGFEVGERARHTRALRDSEERFRAFVTASADVVYRMSFDWSEMRQLEGKAFLHDTDEPSADWLGRYIHPDDQAVVRAAIEEAIRTKAPFELEHRVIRIDGSLGCTESRAVPILTDDGEIGEWLGAASDVTDRAEAQAALRGSQERHAFLLRLSDMLRPLGDPVEIMDVASEALGRHLGVGRCGYGEVDATGEFFTVDRDWTDGKMASFRGRHRLVAFGPDFTEAYRAGQSVLIDHALADTRATGAEAAFEAAGGVRASLGVPLIKDGRFVAGLFAQQVPARHWSKDDEWLVREVAERTWAAVERARAEAALRESEEERRSLIARMNEGFCILEVTLDDAGNGVDYRFLETNPAFVRQGGFDPAGRLMSEIAPIEPVWPAAYGRVATTGVPERIVDSVAALDRTYDVYAVRVGATEDRRVAVFFSDITDRKRAEQALRESEERQAFLLRLSDALRSLGDAVAMQDEAIRILGEHLKVSRAFYSEVSADGDVFNPGRSYNNGVAPMPARLKLSDFGEFMRADLEAGRNTVVEDALADDRFASDQTFEAIELRAGLGVPLVKNGRLRAIVSVHQSVPRAWTQQEIALLKEAADRTWEAVERARAEAALRESEERLQQFGEASQDILWIRNAETLQWVYLTPAFETIYGMDHEAALRGDNMTGWLDLILPEDRDIAAHSMERVRNGEWVTFQFRFRRPSDGEIRWMRNTDFPIRDASGKVVRIGGIGHDITPLKATESALAVADARQRALIDGIPQLVWRAYDGGHWTWASPQWTIFTGQAEGDSHGFGWLDPVHPDDRQAVRDIWATAIERGAFEADYRLCQHAEGRYRWFQTRATPVRDAAGRIVEWLGTSTDVDDLRSLQNRQELLVAELQHRVRNILTIVRSVYSRTAETGGDVQEIADHFKGRLDALARTQVIVTRSARRMVDLEDLIREELLSVAVADGPALTIDGPEVKLPAKVAETLGLALHELTTNALKYGALKVPSGRLGISWSVDAGYGGDRILDLRWTEQGVPAISVRPTREGFGRELIEEALPYRLGAETRLDFGGGGVRCSISIPLPPEHEDSPADTEASL